MTIEYFVIFKKQKPTPSYDSCGLCDPEKSEDKATRICSYCTQTLIKIQPYVWEHLLSFSINQDFPEWFIAFCRYRADYYKSKTPVTVKSVRTDAKLTQQQLADILGIPVRTIQRWEARDTLANKQVLHACS